MRTSLKKLRAFGIHKNGDGKLRRLHQPSNIPHFDQLARATQDMGDMRDCYDSLLSAAAATANSAYEFSESLKEMGSCLLEKTALNDDEESGKVLLMMGKVQFELQKLVDNYRSHIFQTITSPSESLLNELRIVEEMKKLSDEKRSVYEYMTTANKEKGRTKSRKGESFSAQELQTAYEEYDEEATLFVFRLKSLKQGQSRSLLTQAARHHASQMCFFKKALKSLETVEPHVKFITEQQHIDYQFKGLDDDDVSGGDTEDDSDDDEDESDSEQGDGQLSFDHTPEIKEHNIFSTPVDSMELDKAVVSLVPTKVATIDQVKENSDIHGDESYLFRGENRATISQSAPLFAEKKFDPAERVRQMRQLSSRKFHSYVLPTPLEQSKSPVTTKADNPPQSIKPKRPSLSSGSINFRHSSPLVQRNTEEMVKKEKVPVPIKLSPPRPSTSGHLPPPPLAEIVSPQRQDQRLTTSDAKTFKRQAFSGPLTDKSWPNKRGISGSGSTDQSFPPNLFSSPLLHTPALPRSSPPRISPNASPTFVSSPQISELHELPRPPPNKLGGKNLSQVGHSGPLMSRKGYSVESVWGLTSTNRMVPKSASPLPPPPLSSNFSPSLVTMARSFSIPSSREKGSLGITQTKSVENMHSPPLTPMKFSSIEPTTSASSERMM